MGLNRGMVAARSRFPVKPVAAEVTVLCCNDIFVHKLCTNSFTYLKFLLLLSISGFELPVLPANHGAMGEDPDLEDHAVVLSPLVDANA